MTQPTAHKHDQYLSEDMSELIVSVVSNLPKSKLRLSSSWAVVYLQFTRWLPECVIKSMPYRAMVGSTPPGQSIEKQSNDLPARSHMSDLTKSVAWGQCLRRSDNHPEPWVRQNRGSPTTDVQAFERRAP